MQSGRSLDMRTRTLARQFSSAPHATCMAYLNPNQLLATLRAILAHAPRIDAEMFPRGAKPAILKKSEKRLDNSIG